MQCIRAVSSMGLFARHGLHSDGLHLTCIRTTGSILCVRFLTRHVAQKEQQDHREQFGELRLLLQRRRKNTPVVWRSSQLFSTLWGPLSSTFVCSVTGSQRSTCYSETSPRFIVASVQLEDQGLGLGAKVLVQISSFSVLLADAVSCGMLHMRVLEILHLNRPLATKQICTCRR